MQSAIESNSSQECHMEDNSKGELTEAIKKLKNRKAPGSDKIATDMFKIIGEQAISTSHDLQ